VNFDDPQKEMFSDLIESSEPMRIPNYFNPWEDVWDRTSEKFEFERLSVSNKSLEISKTRYYIYDGENRAGEKCKTLEVIITDPEIDNFGPMSITMYSSNIIHFDKNASLLLFEYENSEGKLSAGLIEADADTGHVNIYSLKVDYADNGEVISGYIYRLSRSYRKGVSEFKMKRSEDGWIFMLKSPDGVEGKSYSGDDIDKLWKGKK
jgi:hypothetical protein